MSVINKKFQILLIEDSHSVGTKFAHAIKTDDTEARGLSWLRTVKTAPSNSDGLKKVKTFQPDLIILDIVTDGTDGFEVLRELKRSYDTKDIPVIIIADFNAEEHEEAGLSLGAVDYISKPIKEKIALARIAVHQKIIEHIRKIKHESMYDPLTNVFNRRSFDIQAKLLWEYCIREKQSISLLLLDIDNFKFFNDEYGHMQGDIALQILANSLLSTKRRTVDTVFRWGGEEFAIILPGSNLESSMMLGEMFRKKISNLKIPLAEGGKTLSITVSVGVASMTPDENKSFDTLIKEADKAMYMAKEAGKNRVCSS